MKKISYADLLPNKMYEAQRDTIRQSIMEHKKTRRVQVGKNMMLHFEAIFFFNSLIFDEATPA